MPIAAKDGNVSVGLEDSRWQDAGKLAQTNAVQVHRIRQIVEGLGLAVATLAHAGAILQLKGGDRVGFCIDTRSASDA